MAFIQVSDVSKEFKVSRRGHGIPGMIANMFVPRYEHKKAVDHISFSIEKGEMAGFIGPNGAGKSTTIKMLSGILYPDSGSICVDGFVPYKQRRQYVSRIGVVFGQKSQLQWDLPCMETFELLRCVYGVPQEKYKKIRDRLVELLDMGSFLQQPVRQLSLGQRMRADIVASLLHSPEIVFFDEPTIGVDVVGKETIRNFICELNKEDGVTMLFTTHDMQDIEKTCKRLIIINKGAKEYDGSLEGIRRAYSVSRQIEVEFLKEEEIAPIEHVEIKNLENRKKRFVFDSDQVKINDIMTFLFTHYDIRDLQIVEPEIEGIIRKIYSGDYQRGGMA